MRVDADPRLPVGANGGYIAALYRRLAELFRGILQAANHNDQQVREALRLPDEDTYYTEFDVDASGNVTRIEHWDSPDKNTLHYWVDVTYNADTTPNTITLNDRRVATLSYDGSGFPTATTRTVI